MFGTRWVAAAGLCAAVVVAGRAAAQGPQAGVAAYTFRKLTAFEAIEQTRACGGEVIEFFLWQRLSPAHPEVVLDQTLSDGQVDALKAKLQAEGVRAVNAYFNNSVFKDPERVEENLRALFVFARKLGLKGLTGEPPSDRLDLVERLVKEYDVRLHFHNHPKDPARPDYRNWDPVYLAGLMEGRDPRMGFSLDTGHVSRSGLDPVEAARVLGKRVLSVHLKDVLEAKKESVDVRYGEGIGNLAAVLAQLKAQGFGGHIAVEYENTTDKLLEDVAHCLAYIRRHTGR